MPTNLFAETVGVEVQLVTSVPAATASSPAVAINTADSRVYFRDDLGGGVYVYTETRTNPAPDEVVMVNSIPAATSASPELIINRTDGKAYYLDDLGGGVYVYTQVSA
jgi:hypothetical protein